MGVPPHQIIAWDYQFAPNAQKSRNYLYAANIPFKICEQPFFVPRPILHSIGVTYRRVPVLSIGKDVFCDNSSFIEAIQSLLEKQGKGLKRRTDDRAFEAWGYRSFWVALPTVPADFVTEQLAKDREELFPLFARKDYNTLQVNATSEFRSMLVTAENEFLSGEGPWIGGKDAGIADIHAIWIIKWALKTLELEKQPGFSKDALPKVHRWINSIPHHDDNLEKNDKITEEQAREQIFASEYALPDIGVDETDPLKLKAGDKIAVEATDASPGVAPQRGTLVGLDTTKVVLQVDNGLRVHFPRIGYLIKKS